MSKVCWVIGLLFWPLLAWGGEWMDRRDDVAWPAMTFHDGWHGSVTVHFWTASVDSDLGWQDPGGILGRLGASLPVTHVYASTSDLLAHTGGLFMGEFELGKGRWSVSTNLVWLNEQGEASAASSLDNGELLAGLCGNHNCAASVNLDAEHDTFFQDLNVNYQMTPRWDLVVGMRYLDIDTTASVDGGFTATDISNVLGVPESVCQGPLRGTWTETRPGTAVSPAVGQCALAGNDLTVLDSNNDWLNPLLGVRYQRDITRTVYTRALFNYSGFGWDWADDGMRWATELRATAGFRLDNLLRGLATEFGYYYLGYEARNDDVDFRQITQGALIELRYRF